MTHDSRRRAQRGFTLLELLVVMTIIGILAAIAVPSLRDSPKRAREATLRADLFTFRSVIDQYKGDKGNCRRSSRKTTCEKSRSTR